jgi:hypothetical protein
MNSTDLIPDDTMDYALEHNGFDNTTASEGRLMVTELAVKANAGCYNSHTEEALLSTIGLLKRDRTLNKFGRNFICSMLYKHSNNKSDFVTSSIKHRK